MEMFQNEFTEGIRKGRKQNGETLFQMFVWFGDIFATENHVKKSTMTKLITSGGMKFSDLITKNMKAFMRTILETGCKKDWPEYYKSEQYLDWERQKTQGTLKPNEKRPVSVCLVLIDATFLSQF